MPIHEFTDRIAAQLLANTSRKSNINSVELCRNHFEMGKYLAYHMLEEFELEETEIRHVQGIKKGVQLANRNDIVIVPLMRAGLYAAEGIRTVFNHSQFILQEEDLPDLQDKIVIIVDAVINTGRSMLQMIEKTRGMGVKKVFVATLVMQKEALSLVGKYPEIAFYALRVSENKYVGKGGTDTGNRLFNTFV